MHPVMVMFIGTCADMRPIRIIFSPVSGWKAESKIYLAFHSSSSVRPGDTTPCLRRRQTQPLMQTQQRHVLLLLLSAILVVTDDFVCMGQLIVGEEDVPGVCDSEEVLSPTQKCALVPPGLLDVYGGG